MPPEPDRQFRNETVDALRGAAALSVCFFHFTAAVPYFADVSLLRGWGAYGKHGVEAFFVISGFILPHALSAANFTLDQWPRFMAKRLLRLEPPYLVSIVFVVALWAASSFAPGYRGGAVDVSATQVVAHVGYLSAFVGMPWLNPVYWTLAIEFQFYVLIGALYPLLVAGAPPTRLLLIAGLAAVPMIFPSTSEWLVTEYLPIFSVGLLTFLFVRRLITAQHFWIALGAMAGLLLTYRGGAPTTVATLMPAVLIATVKLPRFGPVAWVGAVSYSLYLLHAPIGGRVMSLTARFSSSPAAEAVGVVLAIGASLLAAGALFVLVERPSRDLAARISYAYAPMPRAQLAPTSGDRAIR